MYSIVLPLELEQFASEAIAAGRYRDAADIVRAGVELLQRHEQASARVLKSVLLAKDEAQRVGYLTGDEVADHMRQTIAQRTGTTG